MLYASFSAFDPPQTFPCCFLAIRIIKFAMRIVGKYSQLRGDSNRSIILHINRVASVAVCTQFRDERLEVDGAFRATGTKGEL